MNINITKLDRIGVGILFLVCVLALPAAMLAGVVNKNEAEPRYVSPFEDRLISVRLTGLLVESDEDIFASVSTVDNVKRRLRKALKDEHVKGILLRIDSPGGTVATSQELSDYLLELKKKKIPLVASMGDVAASGGYYVATVCDKIVAHPGTVTGSIGVIMNSFNLKGLEQKLGIEPQVVKSGKFKDIGSPHRPMTPEEREILQSAVMDSYDQFLDAVSSGRKMAKERVRQIADGRIYLGRQALKLGLVDQLGGYEAAVASLQQLSKERYGHEQDLKLDEGRRSSPLGTLMELLSARVRVPSMPLGLIPESMQARFHKMPMWVMQ